MFSAPKQCVADILHLAHRNTLMFPTGSRGTILWWHILQPPFKRRNPQEPTEGSEKFCLIHFHRVYQILVIPKHLWFKRLIDKVGWFGSKVIRTVKTLKATSSSQKTAGSERIQPEDRETKGKQDNHLQRLEPALMGRWEFCDVPKD